MEKNKIPTESPEQSGIESGSVAVRQQGPVSCSVVPAEQSRSFLEELDDEWLGLFDRIGDGIEGTITRNKIAHAIIYEYDMAFFLHGDRWSLSSDVAQGAQKADCVIEMSHDMDPSDFDGDYTVTDMIRDSLNAATERFDPEGGF